jgi:hypothetical protein
MSALALVLRLVLVSEADGRVAWECSRAGRLEAPEAQAGGIGRPSAWELGGWRLR